MQDQTYQDLYDLMKDRFESMGLTYALEALKFAAEKHSGQFRRPVKAEVPYMIHPLRMAAHAWALRVWDDEIHAAILLHDVCEDCNVSLMDLPGNDKIHKLVVTLSRCKFGPSPEGAPLASRWDTSEYYRDIFLDSDACFIKCLDRIDNLREAAVGFSAGKLADYLDETEERYPRLLEMCEVDYGEFAWTLGYQMRGLVHTLWVYINSKK